MTAYASPRQVEFERLLALRDAYRGCELAHRRASDRAAHPQIRDSHLRRAHERARFARELDTELRALGVPEPDDLRASEVPALAPCTEADASSRVALCERQIAGEIGRVLEGEVPDDLRRLLERHARALQAVLVTAS